MKKLTNRVINFLFFYKYCISHRGVKVVEAIVVGETHIAAIQGVVHYLHTQTHTGAAEIHGHCVTYC